MRGMNFTRPALLLTLLLHAAIGCIAEEPLQDKAKDTAAGSEPRYRIVEGHGYTVCEGFLKNLNAFPADEPPLVCEQKIHPTHPEFSRPDWEEMDIQENLPLIHKAESLLVRFTPIGTEPKPFDLWQATFQQRIQSGEAVPRLRKVTLPFPNGEQETLIWYEYLVGECRNNIDRIGLGRGPGGHIFVLRTQTGELQAFGGLLGTEERTDVLLYRGRSIYFTEAKATSILGPIPIWYLGLHPLSPRRTYGDRYLIQQRCVYHADRIDMH